MTKIYTRTLIGIKKGFYTSTLPVEILEFLLRRKPLIRIMRVLGGISLLSLLGRSYIGGVSGLFLYLAFLLSTILVIYHFYILIVRVKHIYKILKSDELNIRNSPLDKYSSVLARLVFCAKGVCDTAPSVGLSLGLMSGFDQIMADNGHEKFFTPLIGKGLNLVLPQTDLNKWKEKYSLAERELTNNYNSNNNQMVDNDTTIDINNNLDENLDNFINNIDIGPLLIYSTIEELSKIEKMIQALFNLEYFTLGSLIIILNILFIRFLLKNYKEYVKKIINKLTFNKINFDNIVSNILDYNYKFYNLIIMINTFFFIKFKLSLIFFIFNLYLNSLDYIIDYMLLNYIIVLKEGTNSVIFNSLNFNINSILENILLGLLINNIIILLLLVYNIRLNYKNKLNNNILILSLFFILTCMSINFYYLSDLNLNIIFYISNYIDLHIVL